MCFLTSVVVFGTTYSFSVFFDAFVSDFPTSRARLSLIFGVQTFVIYAGAAVAGPVVARLGPRRSLQVGTVLLGVGLLGASYSRTVWALVGSYGAVAAAGLSLLYLVAYATVPRWFGRRRGFATGLATAGLGYDLFGSCVRVFVATGAVGFVGTGLVYLAGRIATPIDLDAAN